MPRLLAAATLVMQLAGAVAMAQGGAQGAFGHRWPGSSEPTMYRYELAADSGGGAITIYEGVGPDASSVTLPPLVLSALADRMERHAPSASRSSAGYAEVAMERGRLLVAFERRLSFALLGLASALIAVLGLGLIVRRERRRREVLVEARRREVESREAERLRLAREIHDGPVQLLYLAQLNLAADRTAAAGDPAAEVGEAVRELRAIAEGLRPPALGCFGLAPALEDLSTRFREQNPSMELESRIDDDGGRLNESARVALFRIAQEALANAAAHSLARHVDLCLSINQNRVQLTVADDGRGVERGETRALGGRGRFGLLGMRERAELLGGTLQFRSRPGRGTRVHLSAALPAPERSDHRHVRL